MAVKFEHSTFDVHIHVGNWGVGTAENGVLSPLSEPYSTGISSREELRRHMQAYNISKIIVTPVFHPKDPLLAFKFNKLVMSCVEDRNVFGGIWVSPMPDTESHLEDALKKAKHSKVKVLSLNPSAWNVSIHPATWYEQLKQNMDLICNFAVENGKILQVNAAGSGNSHVAKFPAFMEKYGKELKVHFVHSGSSIGGVLSFAPILVKLLGQGHEVYCDTSYAPGFATTFLLRSLNRIGKGEVLTFGSDFPWNDYHSQYWKIHGLNIGERLKRKIFYENADAIYGEE